jgi:hypothetical protein
MSKETYHSHRLTQSTVALPFALVYPWMRGRDDGRETQTDRDRNTRIDISPGDERENWRERDNVSRGRAWI